MNIDLVRNCFEGMIDLTSFVDNGGEIYTLKDMCELIKEKKINCYDGLGEVMFDDKIVTNASLFISSQVITIDGIISFDISFLSVIYRDKIKICWYNR